MTQYFSRSFEIRTYARTGHQCTESYKCVMYIHNTSKLFEIVLTNHRCVQRDDFLNSTSWLYRDGLSMRVSVTYIYISLSVSFIFSLTCSHSLSLFLSLSLSFSLSLPLSLFSPFSLYQCQSIPLFRSLSFSISLSRHFQAYSRFVFMSVYFSPTVFFKSCIEYRWTKTKTSLALLNYSLAMQLSWLSVHMLRNVILRLFRWSDIYY